MDELRMRLRIAWAALRGRPIASKLKVYGGIELPEIPGRGEGAVISECQIMGRADVDTAGIRAKLYFG